MKNLIPMLFCWIVLGFSQPLASQAIQIDRLLVAERCILGYLSIDGEVLCYTLELPYWGNLQHLSTIPSGTYSAHVRTDGPKGWRIELDNVPNRTNVQIHIGNYTRQIQGCTLVGMEVNTDQCAVYASRMAMQTIRDKMAALLDYTITVRYAE